MAAVAAVAGGAYAAIAASSSKTITACVHRIGGGLYQAHKCAPHDKRLQWNVRGPTGQTGAAGPGALEYTYDTSTPTATEQNTPLGPAGPFSKLTGSCTTSNGAVTVALGAINAQALTIDRTQTEQSAPAAANTTLQTVNQAAASSSADLLDETSSSGESYNQATLTLTAPVHGMLEVFEHVSRTNNTCHLSVTWTPAG